MLETDTYKLTANETLITITLNATQQKNLKKTLKCGIYKELHKRELLSNTQLNELLTQNT